MALLVALAFGQIAQRQLSVAIAWGDPLMRLLVLWVGVLGAVAARRANEHISIDAISRFLPRRVRLAASALIGLFTSGVCGLLAFHAVRLVRLEYQGWAGPLGVLPGWVQAVVLPAGSALIAARYAILSSRRVLELARPEAER